MKRYAKIIGCIGITILLLTGCTDAPTTPDGKVDPHIEASLHEGTLSTVEATPRILIQTNSELSTRS